MDQDKVKQEVLTYIKAKYPMLYIISPEERRVEVALLSIAGALDMGLRVWTITGGFSNVDGTDAEACADPSEALSTLSNTNGRSIFLLKDFHPFLDSTNPSNVPVIRLARDVARDLKVKKRDQAKTVIFLSSKLTLPQEMQSEIAAITWPRPDEEELLSAIKEFAESLPDELKQNLPQDLLPIAMAAKGLTMDEAQNCIAKSLVSAKTFDAGLIAKEKKQLVQKDGVLEWMKPVEGGLDAVGGMDVLKQWLMLRERAFSKEATLYGLPKPKGFSILGPPGVGKSLAAKATAMAWNMPLIKLDFGKLFGPMLGESEQALRKALSIIETVAPCVVLADEVDKGLGGMDGSSGDSGTSSRIFGSFLTWLQEKTAPAFVIMTLNRVAGLPPELFRKGRIDELFFADLPSQAERRSIFAIHLTKRKRDPKLFDLALLADATQGFSGAEIEACVIDGMFAAFAQSKEVGTANVLTACKEMVPLSKTAAEKMNEMRAWAKGKAKPVSSTCESSNGKRLENIEI